jgi:hypothetical protein
MSKMIASFTGIVAVLFAVTVWAQTPQQVAQCRTANLKAHSEVVQLYQRARAAGRIDPREAQAFAAIDGRLRAHAQALNRGGLTLGECQQLTREIAAERATVQRMAATPDPRVAQCRTANLKAHSEVVQLYQKARAAGRINPREAQAFAAIEGRLRAHEQALNIGGLTLAECQQLTREIAAERASVQRMAATR